MNGTDKSDTEFIVSHEDSLSRNSADERMRQPYRHVHGELHSNLDLVQEYDSPTYPWQPMQPLALTDEVSDSIT